MAGASCIPACWKLILVSGLAVTNGVLDFSSVLVQFFFAGLMNPRRHDSVISHTTTRCIYSIFHSGVPLLSNRFHGSAVLASPVSCTAWFRPDIPIFNILFDQYGTVTIRKFGDTFPIMLVAWLWLVLVKSNSHDDLRCENHRIDLTKMDCHVTYHFRDW